MYMKCYNLIGLIIVACLASGCGYFRSMVNEKQPYMDPDRIERGLVVVLPGIEGRSPLNEEICRGLNDGGVDWAIELMDWTSWAGPLYDQRAQEHNRRKACEIAALVLNYKQTHPGSPVVLVGQSGGGAMAIWTAEALPPDCTLDGIILLAASLSPNYDLELALSKTRRGIVSFYSSRDWLLLGFGTTVVGTMDGEHSSSAGKVGFELPLSVPQYKKLYQIPWSKEMSSTGYTGQHMNSGAKEFVVEYVVPFVRAPRWNQNMVDHVLAHNWQPSMRELSTPAPPPAYRSGAPNPPANRTTPTPPPPSRYVPPSERPTSDFPQP